jgi:3-methylcrotonyl-CoA carboxylase alpha subunit
MALKAARSVNYVGAGTVEFIADGSGALSPERIWFMEMNTRLQVEHPVTEAITGLDLVEWQLRVAQGEPLPKRQEEIALSGVAMEARLYAENPSSGFLPSIGRLAHLRLPQGPRVDAGAVEGSEITPFYDPMIAKLIVHAPDRESAAAALAQACAAVEVWPVKTNAGFLTRLARDADFVAGRIDTGFIERKGPSLVAAEAPPRLVLEAAAQALVPHGGDDPWTSLPGFRVAAPPERRVAVEVAGMTHLVEAAAAGGRVRTVTVADQRVAFHDGEAWVFGLPTAAHAEAGQAAGDDRIIAPMPGRIIAVAVKAGDRVAKGTRLLVLEAMKMEHAIVAPLDGIVERLTVALGDQVSEGTVLVQLAAAQP